MSELNKRINSSRLMDVMLRWSIVTVFFFFNDTATTEIYTLSLHDALPILVAQTQPFTATVTGTTNTSVTWTLSQGDRKSTRLNSSHSQISYAVFCLKKKNCLTFRVNSMCCCLHTAGVPTAPMQSVCCVSRF